VSAIKQVLAVGALSLLVAACSDTKSASPTAPTPPTTSAPSVPTTYTLTGTIKEATHATLIPLAGAQVEESISGRRTTSNDQGFYSFSDLPFDPPGDFITVTKVGYKSETRPLRIPSNAAQIVVDVQLVREGDIHTLSGVIVELTQNGLMPVGGVVVWELSCPALPEMCAAQNIVQSVMTDTNGFYSFSGLYAGKNNVVWANKEGFKDPFPQRPEASEGGQTVTIDGDTRFDIQLVRDDSQH
jgi:hypothetical protein